MAHHLHRQIDKLKRMVLSLGGLVEESVEGAIRAVETRDTQLAAQIIEGDAQIDLTEIDIEEECLHTLALYQPVAFDLRYVVSVLKINNELERIADLAVNISEQACFMAQEPPIDTVPFGLLGEMRKVRSMLQRSLDSLVEMDTEMAESVRSADDEVDEVHRKMYLHVEAAIRKQPDRTSVLINLLNVSRHLERIGDHAVNIAEDVIYMSKGHILRHSREHTIPKNPVPGTGG
ncbi:MAG: phosphate signaling complex protein PhoU [Pirellulales bacterium]